ncbi:MAG: heavy metal translocating P-type ATPase [Bdellovibrionales bacterium]
MSSYFTSPSAQSDFSFLDEDSLNSIYVKGQAQQHIRFFVEGIRCAKCLRKIESLPASIPGLYEARVEMGKNLVHVKFDRQQVNPSQIAAKLIGLGFKVRALAQDADVELAQRLEDRRSLIRLAVAAACMGNIMGFAFALYFGVQGAWLTVFSWLSFIFYLPVVTFVAWPFYVGAWQSLKQARISIDLPMAVASLAGFVFSTVQLLRGHTDFYFDSMSGFLFLILLARFVQTRVQRRYLSPTHNSEDLGRARQMRGLDWKWRPTSQLVPGDEILVETGETVPIEGRLLSPRAHISMAWLTGESKPRLIMAGALVPAGAKLLGGAIRISYTKPLAETDFGKTLNEIQSFALTQNRAISTADRWTQWLLGTVFLLALAYLFTHWQASPEEAIHRSLALIVIACPCAMAFGTPLALAFSLRKAKERGLLIADANVFESTTRIKNVFFDKTGTLTDAELSLSTPVARIPLVYQKIILALENQSYHPIAFAFRNAFSDFGKLPPVSMWKETPGRGVSGYVFGKFYNLQSIADSKAQMTSCELLEDAKLVMRFEFEASLKPGAEQTLKRLRQNGLSLQLISGDNEHVAMKLGQRLGFRPEEIHANMTPQQKESLVRQTPLSMMIGDGVNDAQAMMSADVAVATSGAVGAALKSSKVYLAQDDLNSLLDLFNISRASSKLMRQNLSLSLIYNLVGAALALTGHINPLLAALLMPISSFAILLNTCRGGQS